MIALKEEDYILTRPFFTKVTAPVKRIEPMVLIECNRQLEKLIRKEYNIKKRNQLERILKANSQIIINSL
jgi:hypothetical protein